MNIGDSLGAGIVKFYKKTNKWLFFIPLLIFVLAIAQISIQQATQGDFVKRGVSLTGGLELEFYPEEAISPSDLETHLKNSFPEYDFSIRALSKEGVQSSITLTSTSTEVEELKAAIQEFTEIEEFAEPSITSSSLGESFFRQTLSALIIAFILIAIVVYLHFKVLVPSGFIVLTLLSDIIVTVAIVNLLGITISIAGIVALLMLIGYSVDTDILLTSRILKVKTGTYYSRLIYAMKTGFMMVLTTLAAVTVALVFTNSEFIREVMTIVLIGLIVDLFFTWLQNAPILIYYLERKNKKGVKR